MLPPINGGLHCGGSFKQVAGLAMVGCSRRSTAGSIAACVAAQSPAPIPEVLPPINGGLHCGTVWSGGVLGALASAPADQRRRMPRRSRI